MAKVAIATLSKDKIDGIKEAVSKFLKRGINEIEFHCMKTESGVSDQPFGDETYHGAQNRVDNIRNQLPGMDLYISCEAGIDIEFGHYFNVQVVCVYDSKSQNYLFGKSGGWEIPAKDIPQIQETNLDIYLRNRTGITCIEELLGEENSRKLAVAQALSLALASERLLENKRQPSQIGEVEAKNAADAYAVQITAGDVHGVDVETVNDNINEKILETQR